MGRSSRFFMVGNTSGNSSNRFVWYCINVAADLIIWCVGGAGKWNMLVLVGVGRLDVGLEIFLRVFWLAVDFQGASVILF